MLRKALLAAALAAGRAERAARALGHRQEPGEINPHRRAARFAGRRSADGVAAREYIRDRGWNTAVSGYCFSGCALMYLGGTERGFTDDKPVPQTQLGFQGTHYAGTAYDRTPGSPNISGTIRAMNWIKRRTEGKISDAMLNRFEALPQTDLVHFFDSKRHKGQASVFLCPLGKDGKRKCEPIHGADVYREGIANTDTVIRSNDRR
jgi:hypothetical protein